MNKSFLNEKIKVDKINRTKSDRNLKSFIVIFLIGYIFFFTSNYTLPKIYKTRDTISTGDVVEFDNLTLTFNSWDYAKDDNMFEIIFDVDNLLVADKPEYEFTCRCGDQILPTEVYKEVDENILVLRTTKVPKRFTDISLLIKCNGSSSGINSSDREMRAVKSIRKRSNNEYRIYASECRIEGYKTRIKEKETAIKSKQKNIQSAKKKVDGLKAEMAYQTETEQEKSNQKIQDIEAQISTLEAEEKEILSGKEEYLAKLKIQKQVLKMLKEK